MVVIKVQKRWFRAPRHLVVVDGGITSLLPLDAIMFEWAPAGGGSLSIRFPNSIDYIIAFSHDDFLHLCHDLGVRPPKETP